MSVAHSVAPRRRGLLAALIGVAVALGVALVVVAAILVSRKKPDAVDVIASDPLPTAQATPTAEAPEPVPTVTAPPAASVEAPAASAEAPAASAAPEPKAAAKAPAKPPVGGGTKRPVAAPKPAADGCDPPFTIDKNGVRRVKPGCM